MLKQTISLQIFQRLSSTNFTWSILEQLVPYRPVNIFFHSYGRPMNALKQTNKALTTKYSYYCVIENLIYFPRCKVLYLLNVNYAQNREIRYQKSRNFVSSKLNTFQVHEYEQNCNEENCAPITIRPIKQEAFFNLIQSYSVFEICLVKS